MRGVVCRDEGWCVEMRGWCVEMRGWCVEMRGGV